MKDSIRRKFILSISDRIKREFIDIKSLTIGTIIDSLDPNSKEKILWTLLVTFLICLCSVIPTPYSPLWHTFPRIIVDLVILVFVTSLLFFSILILLFRRNIDSLLKSLFIFFIGITDLVVIGLGQFQKTYLYFIVNMFVFLVFELNHALIIALVIFITHFLILPRSILYEYSFFLSTGFFIGIFLKLVLASTSKVSKIDPLTGLLNRRSFEEIAQRYLDISKRMNIPITVAIADIDNFKKINDTYGHLIGDNILKKIASIIESKTRYSDLVARYGGEEFIILLFNTDENKSKRILNRIRETIENTQFPLVGKVTVSIGASQVGRNYSLSDALKRADEALYKAKSLGKNRVLLWKEIQEREP